MKKARTYVLFMHNDYFKFYLRGAYYNLQMNKILCNDWDTVIYVDYKIAEDYRPYMKALDIMGARIIHFEHKYLCNSMLMRILPIRYYDVISCRDIDAITTLRDVTCVSEFLQSTAIAHGMNDNPAHDGMLMMGGMCSFKKEALYCINLNDLEQVQLMNHGEDQNYLMTNIYPRIKSRFLFHDNISHGTLNPLWESDLTCRHIGSAGINEMETLRFFERNGIDHFIFTNQFKHIF